MKKSGRALFALLCWLSVSSIANSVAALAQDADTSIDANAAVRSYVEQHKPAILKEFVEFLSIPNVASDTANIRKNADAIERMLKQRGFHVKQLVQDDGPPVVIAEKSSDRKKHTVTFYAHYDGQPVQKADWVRDPWSPALVIDSKGSDTRLYARSASDDKAAVMGLIAAYDALKAGGVEPSVNIKFFFEGEEEAGSPHLEKFLAHYADQLATDLWVFCDGPVYQNGNPLLVFGNRGVTTVAITAFGPNRALHSGHYGNWAPNPIVELAHLVAKLRTTEGEITIPHFYEAVRPLKPSEQTALKNLPNLDAQLKDDFGLGRTEGQGSVPEQIMKPALNLDRIEGGGYGPNPANAIPISATAYIDFRLVPDQTPVIVREQLESYLRQLGYFLVHQAPTAAERKEHARLLQLNWGAGYPPQRADMDAPVSQAFIHAARDLTGNSLVIIPTLGGSTPAFLFEQQFKETVITLPIANFDNNQHAANENIKLENLWNGIGMYAAIYSSLGKYWH